MTTSRDQNTRSARGKTVAYYVSAHGYGHGVRSCDILRALRRRAPDLPILLVSDLPQAFLANRLRGAGVAFRGGAFDVGLVQRDSIRVDLEASRNRVARLVAEWNKLVEQERAFLREQSVGLVVVDIPALPLDAAAAAGVRTLAVGNFSWDWIYNDLAVRDPRWQPLIDRFRQAYQRAERLLRLPFAPEMDTFARREDLPLLASPGVNRRAELARLTGAAPGKTWVLVSFTSLDWDDAALRRVGDLRAYEFFTVLPLVWPGSNLHAVDRERIPYSDVMASVDVVVSKPGFGLVSECVVNCKPLIYADRTDFAEYDYLVAGIRRYLRHWHVPSEQLYRGDLAGALDAIGRQPEPREDLPRGGAEVAADRIMERLAD